MEAGWEGMMGEMEIGMCFCVEMEKGEGRREGGEGAGGEEAKGRGKKNNLPHERPSGKGKGGEPVFVTLIYLQRKQTTRQATAQLSPTFENE